jgi:phage-related protein
MSDLGTARGRIVIDASGAKRGYAVATKEDKKFYDVAQKNADKFKVDFAATISKKGKESGGGAAKLFSDLFLPEFNLGIKGIAKSMAGTLILQLAGSLGSALIKGTEKLIHGLAAVIALLPAAALAAGAAVGTLALALSGVGEALKQGLAGDTEKFNEALEKLSPSAREFAREIVGLRGEFKTLQQLVQERFFRPFVNDVRPLAEIYLPLIQRTLTGIATAFGRAIASTIGFLRLPPVARSLSRALENVETAVINIIRGLPNLFRGFLPLVRVGSTFLPGLTKGFQDLTRRFAEFMERIERSGQLRDFIRGGLRDLRSLRETFRQVWRIIQDIGVIASIVFANMGFQTGGLLDTIEDLVQRARDFLQTGGGASNIQTVFGLIEDSAQGIIDLVKRIWTEGIEPILPDLEDFWMSFQNFRTEVLDDLVTIFTDLMTSILPVVLDILTRIMDAVASNDTATKITAIGIGLYFLGGAVLFCNKALEGSATLAFFRMLAPFLRFLGSGSLSAGLITFSAIIVGIVSSFEDLAGVDPPGVDRFKVAFEGIKTTASDAWQGMQVAWDGFLNYMNDRWQRGWEGIRHTGVNIWHGINRGWQISSGFITRTAGQTVDYVKRIWRERWPQVRRVAVNVWHGINRGWQIVTGFVKRAALGAVEYVQRIWRERWGQVRGTAVRIWHGINRAWQIAVGFVKRTALGAVDYIQRIWRERWRQIRDFVSRIWASIKEWVRDGIAYIRDRIRVVLGGIRDTWNRIWGGIRSTAARVWERIIGVIRGAVNTAIGIINGIGNAIETVARAIGIKITIPDIPKLKSAREKAEARGQRAPKSFGMAKGGAIDPNKAGPFTTRFPRAIVGEGSRRWEEFVIPTDPKFRSRALNLYQTLGTKLMQRGGTTRPRGPGIAGLYDPLAAVVSRIISQGRGGVSVISGWRSSASQARLYAAYQAGRGNLAAPPGRSKHEGGAAVDFGGNRSLYTRLARAAGLVAPVRGEPWHWEHPGQRGGGGGGGGGIPILSDLINKIKDAARGIGGLGNKLAGLPRKGLTWLKDKAIGWVKKKAADFLESLVGSAGGIGRAAMAGRNSGNQALGKRLAAARGWTGAQWTALHNLVMSESGWDNTAQNPTSTAYGIGQFLNSTWATVGARKTSDARAQIVAMLRYIAQRFGNPARAWAFKQRNNFYKKGGIISHLFGGKLMEDIMAVGASGQRYMFHRGETLTPARASDRNGRGGDTTILNFKAIINANTEAGGRAAAKGFQKQLDMKKILTDARTA